MNRYSLLIAVICLIFFIRCGPEVKFKSPQPTNKSNLNTIPADYKGTYKNIEDSSVLVINDKSIFKIWKSNQQIQLDSIIKDLKFDVRRDTLIYLNDEFKINVKLVEPNNKVMVSAEERLFQISDSCLVRSYKDFCFLNYKTKDGLWLVKVLRIKGVFMEFTDLVSSKEVELADEFTRVTAVKDTADHNVQEYQLSPTRRELRRLLRHKKFEKEFKKIEK